MSVITEKAVDVSYVEELKTENIFNENLLEGNRADDTLIRPSSLKLKKKGTNKLNLSQKNSNDEVFINSNTASSSINSMVLSRCKYWTSSDKRIPGKMFVTKKQLVFKSFEVNELEIRFDYDCIVDVVKIDNYLNRLKNVLSLHYKGIF
jgi:hypothetical protein